MSIHPAFAEHLSLLQGVPKISWNSDGPDPAILAKLDSFSRAVNTGEPPMVSVRTESAPGPHGPVPVRVYEPGVTGTDRPALVWMHGGAFQFGSLDMPESDWLARELVTRSGVVVISVDYRLVGGEVAYPVPHDDVVAAVRWTRASAAEFKIDATRISVGGASAGGNLAAGATLELRDADGWLPYRLILVYAVAHAVVPPLDPAMIDLMAEVPPCLRLLPEVTKVVNEVYLGGPLSTANGYAFPAQGVLDGLGPTLVLNAEFDDLRPSGQDFAARLARAGVDVQQVTMGGLLHGFLNHSPSIEPVGQAIAMIGAAVKGPPVQ